MPTGVHFRLSHNFIVSGIDVLEMEECMQYSLLQPCLEYAWVEQS